MKRGTIIALAILAVLAVVYFATSSSPRQSQHAPLTVEKVESLDRIEIQPPSGESVGGAGSADAGSGSESSDQPETTVVLEKRDGEWWLTKPVESPAASTVASDIEDVFGSAIATDDLQLTGDASEYGLDEASGVKLSLYGGGASEASVSLVIGEEITVSKTNAKRTFIRESGGSEVYRAQAALGSFVRQSVDDFRSDKIVDLDQKKLSRLEWSRPEGPTIVLKKNKDNWKLLRPQVEWSLDSGEADSIASALASLTADDFADDASLSSIGLKPPAVRLSWKTGSSDENESSSAEKSGSGTLLVGEVEGGEKPKYYAKLADEPFKYQISKYAGQKLIASLGDLRSKKPRSFDKEAITEVRFPGADRVVVRKEEGSWKLVRPDAEKSLNESKLGSRLTTMAELTVKSFPEIEAAKAGVAGSSDRVVFEMKNGDRHTIYFGDPVDEESGDRYVKFGDGDEVFVVSKYTAEKLHPKVDDLVGESKRPPGKGLGKGMGKGMNKLQKMKMMQKLKQRMGKGR